MYLCIIFLYFSFWLPRTRTHGVDTVLHASGRRRQTIQFRRPCVFVFVRAGSRVHRANSFWPRDFRRIDCDRRRIRTNTRTGTAMDPPPPTPNGGGGFLSNRRIKLTAVFPMIGGSRRTMLSKSDSSSLAKTGKATVVAAAAGTATAAERPSHPQQLASRNRMRRGSSLTDLNRSDSLAGTEVSLTVIPNLTPGLVDLKSAALFCVSVPWPMYV